MPACCEWWDYMNDTIENNPIITGKIKKFMGVLMIVA